MENESFSHSIESLNRTDQVITVSESVTHEITSSSTAFIGQGVKPMESAKAQKIMGLGNVAFQKREVKPQDKYFIVYIILMLNGASFLLAWNLINFLAPYYYFMYWFSPNMSFNLPFLPTMSPAPIPTKYAQNFINNIGMAACTPLTILAWIAIIPICRIPMLPRLGAAYTFCLASLVALLIVACTHHPDPGFNLANEMSWFYTFSFVTILVMMGANGVVISYLFGIAADFPRKITTSLAIGINVGGLLSSLIYTCATAGGTSMNGTAIVYYSFCTAFLFLCILSLGLLWFTPYYREIAETGAVARNEKGCEALKAIKDLGTSWKLAGIDFLNIFLVFYTSYTVFPGLAVNVQPSNTPGQAHMPTYFIPIGVAMNFYFFSVLGSVAGSFVKIPPSNRNIRCQLFFPSMFVMIFMIFFAFCNVIPNYPKVRTVPVPFKNEWIYFVGNAVFGLIIGALSTILLMLPPKVVPKRLSRMAGQIAAASMITGLYLGSGTTPAVTQAISAMH